MKRPCLLLRRWRHFALLLVPFLAWGIVLAVVPTDWARARLVGKLARATGRPVRIAALRMGMFGELRVVGLSIAEPATPDDPWLEVDEATIDVHLGQVLCGHCEPSRIAVQGASVRIWRKPDGSLEVGELLVDRSGVPQAKASVSAGEPAGSMTFLVAGSRVRIIDESSGTTLEVTDVDAKLGWARRLVSIESLKGKLNGGTLALAARLDRDPNGPKFEAELRASSVEIDGEMPALGVFLPVVAGATEGLGGKLDLRLALQGRGTTRGQIRRSLRGHGSVMLDPIDLDRSRFLQQLDALGDCPREGRIGSVSSDFRLEDGRITTDDLTIRSSGFPFVLGGWTDLDGRFDYAARVDQITAKLPREAKAWAADLKVGFEQLAGLRMYGSIDQVEVTVHGHPLTGDPDRPDDERARF